MLRQIGRISFSTVLDGIERVAVNKIDGGARVTSNLRRIKA